jgi:hypothetical protein
VQASGTVTRDAKVDFRMVGTAWEISTLVKKGFAGFVDKVNYRKLYVRI